tara:strand:- start:402 stop:932 length:531 start_codon:yes stop_codon:yes gene_type:complete
MKVPLKIIIYGKTHTGTSNLLHVLSQTDSFNKHYKKTNSVNYRKNVYENIIFNFWDLAGDPKFYNFFFNVSNIILLVYKCDDNLDSFTFIKTFYYNNSHLFINKKVILVGNKYDLYNSKKIYKVYKFCKKNKIQNFFTSCKTKYGIKSLINFMLDDYLEKIDEIDNIKYNCCIYNK